MHKVTAAVLTLEPQHANQGLAPVLVTIAKRKLWVEQHTVPRCASVYTQSGRYRGASMLARGGIAVSVAFLSVAFFSTASAQTSTATILQEQRVDSSKALVSVRPLVVTDFAYPLGAIVASEEGTSRLNLIVDTQGRVTFAQLLTSSGSSRLDQAGLLVARTQWQFEVAKRDGQPVVGSVQVDIGWRLPARPANELVFDMIGIPISGRQVTPPSLVREAYRLTSADYPPASARAGEVGEVALKVFILADGSVGEVQMFDSSGYPRLDERAVMLARERFKYKPGTMDGQPTAMWLDVLHGFIGVVPRGRTVPQNTLIRFCHSRPVVGTLVNLSTTEDNQDRNAPTPVQQWIHLTADGSVDDVVMATSRGWVHLSETLVADYTRVARQRPAVPNRPPSCWYNGAVVANAEPPKAVSATELMRRGTMYMRDGKLVEALNDFDEAVNLQPANPLHLNNRCYALALLGRPQEALVDCDKSLQMRRVAATLDSRGFVYLLLQKYDAAIGDYNAALRSGPKLANSLYGRGIAKIRMGNEPEGRADIAEAMKVDQNITARMSAYGFAP